MIKKNLDTCIAMQPDPMPTTLYLIGDVRTVLRASCTLKRSTSEDSEISNIVAIKLSDGHIRFGIGAAAFGPLPELAIQQLGECALIEGIPWWTPTKKPYVSRREVGVSELLTPFLIAWNTLNSAWAFLDSPSSVPLVEWYEQILEHPSIGKTGAIVVELVTQVPAGLIVDKCMRHAPLAQNIALTQGQLITDPDLIDVYFLRNAIRNTVPPNTICTLVMVGIVIDPVAVARTWGVDILQRGFYITPGIKSHANVIHHTHAAVILEPWPMNDNLRSLQFIDEEIARIVQELASGTRKVSVVHIESDIRLNQAVARIGIIENIENIFH